MNDPSFPRPFGVTAARPAPEPIGDDEQSLAALRLATLQTSRNVLALQRRTEQELVAATVALEHQTRELASSLALLNATLESSPEGIVALDLEGRITLFNARFVAMWAFPAEMLLRRDAGELWSHAARQAIEPERFLQRVRAATHLPVRDTLDTVQLQDGRSIERYVSAQIVDGRCAGVVLNFRDVTERRQAARALQHSEAELRLAQRLAQVGNWSWTLADDRVRWSEQVYRIFGLAPAEKPPTRSEQRALYTAEGWQRFTWAFTTTLQSGTAFSIEAEIIRANGSHGWINIRGEAEHDAAGRIVRLYGSAHDISANMIAQRALRDSQRRLQALFDSSLNAILLSDDDGRYVDANPAACTLLGYSRDELLAAPAPTICAESPFPAAPPPRPASGTQQDERRLLRKDGSTLMAEVNAASDVLPGLHLWIFHDITERKAAEALRVAKESAEAANRSKSAFLSRMSHELRTPLNAILGFSEMLQLDDSQPMTAEQAARVERIRSAGTHLLALIEDILDASRIETGSLKLQFESIDALELIGDIVRNLTMQADTCGVTVRVEDALWRRRVLGDRTRLRQVMLNLLSNAIKYNRRGGDVAVRITARGDRLRIHVQDTGLGMSAAQLQALYQPFERLGRETSGIAGTGIGLVITRSLVELMGGTLSIHSEVDVGSEFIVELAAAYAGENPAARAGVLASASAAASAKQAGDRVRGSVLYIDDDEVNRLLMQAYFELRPGLVLQLAEDGASGIAAALATRHDLILIDMRLPDVDGIAVLHALKARSVAPPPCIAVSANAMPDDIDTARAAGFDGYLTKPLSAATLLAELDRVLAAAP